MASKLTELDLRVQSDIPSPVAVYGYSNHPNLVQPIRYDGTATTYFLYHQGADWRKFKEFWRANQIGRVTDDLYPGRMVVVEKIGY